jgi:hypothetical protein
MQRFLIAGRRPICVHDLIGLLAAVALLLTVPDQASAQSRPDPNAVKTIGTCVTIQTNATTVETPIALRAVGSCETPENGNPSNCTASIVPTGPDLILDVTDTTGIPQCLRLVGGGGDPCGLVQNGPLIFQSQRYATQSFSADVGRARMTTMIRQIRVQQTTTDLPPSARFPLNVGRLFDVLRNRSAVAARLECSMADGDPRIFPIVGEADLSPIIRFVSKNSSEPLFDILTYRVTP